jgi:hypothetical protein
MNVIIVFTGYGAKNFILPALHFRLAYFTFFNDHNLVMAANVAYPFVTVNDE